VTEYPQTSVHNWICVKSNILHYKTTKNTKPLIFSSALYTTSIFDGCFDAGINFRIFISHFSQFRTCSFALRILCTSACSYSHHLLNLGDKPQTWCRARGGIGSSRRQVATRLSQWHYFVIYRKKILKIFYGTNINRKYKSVIA